LQLKILGACWFDRDTHQLTFENRAVFSCQWLAISSGKNESRLRAVGQSIRLPMDYKGGEHPQPVIKEFSSHHLCVPISFFF
jgi:hypothetical protein